MLITRNLRAANMVYKLIRIPKIHILLKTFAIYKPF